MENYDVYILQHKSCYNKYVPDIMLQFTTHKEENLNSVLDYVCSFLVSCGYSKDAVIQEMHEYNTY